MANIKDTLALRAAREEANKPAELPEWQQKAEEILQANPTISRSTVPTFAESVAKTGFPKNLTFCGVCVHIKDEPDLAEFWKTVYANLTKAEYAELAKPDHKPITEQQVAQALYRSYQRIGVATDLVQNGIEAGALEFESEGAYYVLAAGMVITLDGHVVADVSDIQTPFGPEEWVEVANRIKAAKGPKPTADDDDWNNARSAFWRVSTKEARGSGWETDEEFDDYWEAAERYGDCVHYGGFYAVKLSHVAVFPDGHEEEDVTEYSCAD